MGSARSVPDWVSDRVDEETVRRMAGNRFDPERWERLSVDGWITRDLLEVEARRVERYDGEKDGRGLRRGLGTCVVSDGDKYKGEWLLNMRHGLGVHYSPSGETYKGQWKGGKRHGLGHDKDPEGTEYWGEWARGKYHGLGVLALADSYRFEGRFADGQPGGLGLYIRPTGEAVPGKYVDGEPREQGAEVMVEAEAEAARARDARDRALQAAADAQHTSQCAPVTQAELAAQMREERMRQQEQEPQ